MAKKYYWLKLKDDFFTQPRIKKLRRIAGGDTYTLIYLKLQLLSLKNNGILVYEGIEEDFAEEIALTIDEETDNVRFTVMYLLNQGLMEETTDGSQYALTETMKNIGSETAGAERVRRFRENQKALQSNAEALPCNSNVTKCNTEKREKRKEIDIEIEKESKGKAKRFTPPAREDVQAYIVENGYSVDAERFIDYYTANGWKVGKSTMKDWKAAVRNWNRRDKESGYRKPNEPKQSDAIKDYGDPNEVDAWADFFGS